jgi:hypothetical protein
MRLVRLTQRFQLLGGQFHLQRSDRLLQVLHLTCADDRSRHSRLRENPRQRDLHIGNAALLRCLAHTLHDGEIGVLILKLLRIFVRLRPDGFSEILLAPVAR